MGEDVAVDAVPDVIVHAGLTATDGLAYIVVALGRFPSAAALSGAHAWNHGLARLLRLLLRFEQDVDLVVVDLLRRLARVVLRVVVQGTEPARRGDAGRGGGRSVRSGRVERVGAIETVVPCRQKIFLGAREGRRESAGRKGTHHCSSSPSRSDTSLGTRRHFSHESHWTHASEHRGLSSASSAAEGPSPSSSAMVAAPAYEIGPLGVATAIVRDARTRGIERDARGGSIDARGSIARCATRRVRRRGPGSDRRVVGWHVVPPAAPVFKRRAAVRSVGRRLARGAPKNARAVRKNVRAARVPRARSEEA